MQSILLFIDKSDIMVIVIPTPLDHVILISQLMVQIEATDDEIAEYTEVFDVVVEAVNPLDSVSSMNTSTIYIFDDDGKFNMV